MEHVAITTKKFLAAGGLAFGLSGFGLFAGVGTAAATAPDTGSYDELLNLALAACWESGMSSGCDHSRLTSSYPAEASWPGG